MKPYFNLSYNEKIMNTKPKIKKRVLKTKPRNLHIVGKNNTLDFYGRDKNGEVK
jgi:hypothetical protein